MHCTSALWPGDDVRVVEKGEHRLSISQAGGNVGQGSMLSNTIKRRHQGIPLLPPLALHDVVLAAIVV